MRKDQQLSKKYKKNQHFENVQNSMNEQLSIAQNDILNTEIEENFSTIHILGAPRSGTTLISQLIPSFLPVGYINNLIASFWKAPIYGIELSKKLIKEDYKSSFKSDYGRTNGIKEPHEFGYFWNYHLKYDSLAQKEKKHEKNINWTHLALLMNNMTASFEKPIVFKSFLLGFHAAELQKYLTKTKFIYIKRNLVDNVLSIIKLRKTLNGDINAWGSIKPKQYAFLKDLNIYEQIVGQILCLEHEYLQQLKNIPQSNKMIVSYEQICQDPEMFLNTINQKFLKGNAKGDFQNIPNFKTKKNDINTHEYDKIITAKTKILKQFPELSDTEI